MAVRYAVATGNNSDGTVTFTEGTPLPTGYVLVAFMYRNQSSAIPTPSGWTKIGENDIIAGRHVAVFARRSNGSVNSINAGGSSVTWRGVLLAYESAEDDLFDSSVFGEASTINTVSSISTGPVTPTMYGVTVALLNAGSSSPGRTWGGGLSEAHQSSNLLAVGERIGAPATFTPSVSWGTPTSIHQLTAVHIPLEEPPPPVPGDNLDYFSWDGTTLTPLDLLGAYSE